MVRFLFAITLGVLMSVTSLAPAVERSEIPDKYKWDRTHIFASDADWEAAKVAAEARIPEIEAYEGRLGESAATLHEALSTLMSIRQDLSKVNTYASMLRDEDSRVGKSNEMAQSARQLFVKLGTASSYMQPELIALGTGTVMEFVDADDRLEDYRTYLDDLVRWAPHTLSADEEKLIARAGDLTNAGMSVHNTFTNAELPYPEVTLSNGETVTLDASGYAKYRGTANREDRIKVFQTFWDTYKDYTGTLAASLYAQVKSHMFYNDVHNFDNSLERALFNNNIPTSVYRQLIEDVHENLPTLHRYLKLKERMLGLDKIGYEDLYAASVKEVDLTYSPEEAIDLCIRSNGILGEEYVEVLSGAFEQGWMDILPSPGKRSGAYSTMVWGVHPYQLLNFNGGYDDVSTMAHESGHSMHSYLSSKTQPYVTASYSIFVAEVASTLNENLLFYSVLGETRDRESELYILGNALENFRTTMFRQVMFAEFELLSHEMAEAGTPFTGENLSELYLGLLKKYYGHDEGVCNIDDLYAAEWAYIPHFYYNFYVYQYATSLVAGTTLAKNVRDGMAKGDTTARDKYLALLSAGSSKYPIDLLKDAGVDMTTSEPFVAATREMNEIMDRIELLLDSGDQRMGGGGR